MFEYREKHFLRLITHDLPYTQVTAGRSSEVVLYGTEVCTDAHILASASTSLRLPSASLPSKFEDLALRFPELYRTKLIFQDFPGTGNFTNTIPGLSRKRGNSGFILFIY